MAGYPWTYAYAGPPFHWLGNFSMSQWKAFKTWANQRVGDVKDISTLHRIKAEQLRKTAGVLEQYYSSVYPQEQGSYGEKLAPTFQKTVWKPNEHGHFDYLPGDDQLPMVMVGKAKGQMKDMLQRHEDAVYFMNQVRCLIEKHEDWAQYASDFAQGSSGVPGNPVTLADILAKVDGYFTRPEYQHVLVDDISNLYKGQPYYRVHPADPPTQWELEQSNHSPSSFPIGLVDTEKIDP